MPAPLSCLQVQVIRPSTVTFSKKKTAAAVTFHPVEHIPLFHSSPVIVDCLSGCTFGKYKFTHAQNFQSKMPYPKCGFSLHFLGSQRNLKSSLAIVSIGLAGVIEACFFSPTYPPTNLPTYPQDGEAGLVHHPDYYRQGHLLIQDQNKKSKLWLVVCSGRSRRGVQGRRFCLFPIQIAPRKWLDPPPFFEENSAGPPPPPPPPPYF